MAAHISRPMIDRDGWTLLLDRYLAGECTVAERVEVQRWLAQDAPHAVLLEQLAGVRKRNPVRPADATETEASLARLRAHTLAAAQTQSRIGPSSHPLGGTKGRAASSYQQWRARELPRPWPWGLRSGDGSWLGRRALPFVAGAVAMALVAVALRGHRDRLARDRSVREYLTHTGERETVTLSDGTQFTLAPASRIRLAPDYGAARRDVYLDGAAYFAVAHDATHPFSVHVGNAVARDIGTAFAVTAYRDEGPLRVVVTSGVVVLGAVDASPMNRGPVTLRPGDLATLDATGTLAVRHDIDASRYTGWSAGRIAFDDVPLRDVLAELSRWYAIEISTPDGRLAGRRVTATFTDGDFPGALRFLATVLGARVERHERAITLTTTQTTTGS